MSVYFRDDGNTVYVPCRTCGPHCCDAALFGFVEDAEDGNELYVFPMPGEHGFWQRLREAWRFLWRGTHWNLGLQIGWHEATDREGVKALGEWIVEKSQQIGREP